MTLIQTPQAPADPRQFANGIDADGKVTFARVGVEDIDYRGRFGAIATSTTENEVSIGEKYFTLDVDEGKIRVGDDVLLISLDDQDCHMWGEVIGTDTVAEPLRIRVFVDDISALTNTSRNWEIQVVARPKPGIEKDTSLTEFDPTDGGPWTLTVTAGKFFPIGGTLLIKPTTDRTIAVIGEVKAYSGTGLTVSLRSTNATVSTSYDSWSIALLDSPPAKLPFYGINGLVVTTGTSANKVSISAGSVMDSTGAVELRLESAIVKYTQTLFAAGSEAGGVSRSAALGGTISSSGTTVTGSGTAFVTNFHTNGKMNDLSWYDSGGFKSIISTAAETSVVASQGGQTTQTTTSALGASAGTTYYRGGVITSAVLAGSGGITYFLCIIRKDSDGSIDACFCSLTRSGEPDLPAGYTYYRIICIVNITGSVASPTYTYTHPLHDLAVPNDSAGNAKLADMAAYTLKGRNAGTTGDPSDIDISALTEKTTPVAADLLLIQDSAASNAFKKVQAANLNKPVLIASGSFPAAATLSITDIPANFSYIQIMWNGVSCDTATRMLQLRLSVNNGSSYDGTAGNYPGFTTTGGTTLSAKSSATCLPEITLSNAAHTFKGSSFLINVGGMWKQYQSSAQYPGVAEVFCIGRYENTTVVDAMQFLWNGSGNFDAGTYAVYGVR